MDLTALPNKLNSTFHQASGFVSRPDSSQLLSHLTTSEKLRLYALYKLVTNSGAGPLGSASFWDFEAKAKAEAWKSVKLELEAILILQPDHTVPQLAAQEYIQRVRQVGWVFTPGELNDEELAVGNEHELAEDDTTTRIASELNDFLADGGMDVLGLASKADPQDSESDMDENETDNEQSGSDPRDEYGLEIERELETNQFDSSQAPGSESRSNALRDTKTPPPGLSMVSVSKMLDAMSDSQPGQGKGTSLHDLVIDHDEVGISGLLGHLLESDNQNRVRQVLNEYNTDVCFLDCLVLDLFPFSLNLSFSPLLSFCIVFTQFFGAQSTNHIEQQSVLHDLRLTSSVP